MIEIRGKYTNCKVFVDKMDENVINQLNEVVNHPAFTNPIRVMPDVHAGKGAVIGFTMPLDKNNLKVIPNIIGVDIGCGVKGINIGPIENIEEHLVEIDRMIKNRIPLGKTVNSIPVYTPNEYMEKKISDVCKRIQIDYDYTINSVGTLGGGNHFIEIGKDDHNNVWLICHTGSRQFGKKIAEYWQKKAISELSSNNMKSQIEQIKSSYPKEKWEEMIQKAKNSQPKIRKELSYLEGDLAEGYMHDMRVAQVYAIYNRYHILLECKKVISKIMQMDPLPTFDVIDTIHNYIDIKDYIVRKGAVKSISDTPMLIPFNRQYGTLIVKGKSNPDWNYSAPHGAGRLLSRRAAKEQLDMDKYTEQMKGIYSSTVNEGNLDEAPDAYKDPEIIREQLKETAEIVGHIRPIYSLKD